MLRAALFALAMIAASPPVAAQEDTAPVAAQEDTAPVAAQEDTAPVVTPDNPTPVGIVTVDIDRLFTATELGQRITDDFRIASEALAAENRTIAAALTEEESNLTERRPAMDPAAFRAEAEAFDEKVQGIRAAQDAKERALDDSLAAGRDNFFVAIRPILGQLMVENGAGAILDRRSVVLSVGRIDITDAAIAVIDATVGDGTGPDGDSTGDGGAN